MRGCFVTGTDTGVGKTVLAGSMIAAMRAGGARVGAIKPLVSGLDEPAREEWPHDHELLALVAGRKPEEVVVHTFGPPVSPHLALELSGQSLEPAELVASVLAAAEGSDVFIVEGVGGLLVPITDGYDVRCLAVDIGLPLVIAARPGLGTINHTLLTIEAARAKGLSIAGVVLTPWPEAPSAVERSNWQTIERLGEVEVASLPYIGSGKPELLAKAGRLLPLDRWLA